MNVLRSFLIDVNNGIKKVQGNIKYLPICGKAIYSLIEYCKYIFKYRGILRANANLKNKYNGERCFVLGNGPSLKEVDLNKLKGEYVITVNSMSSTNEFNNIKPIFHVIVDYLRFDKEIPELYRKLEELIENKHKTTYVFPVEVKSFIDSNGLNEGIDIIYICRKPYLSRIYDIDISKRIPFYGNVVNGALSLAISLGFSEIYLLGCDMTNVVKIYDEDGDVHLSGHFYTDNIKKDELKRTTDLVEKHMNETYLFTYGSVFRIFRYTREYASRVGGKIFNATKGGTLDVFPRVKFEDLFKKVS